MNSTICLFLLVLLQGIVLAVSQNIISSSHSTAFHCDISKSSIESFGDPNAYDIKMEMNLVNEFDIPIIKLLDVKAKDCDVWLQGSLQYMLRTLLKSMASTSNGKMSKNCTNAKTKHNLIKYLNIDSKRLQQQMKPLKFLAELSVNSLKFAEIKMISYGDSIWAMTDE